MTEKGTNEFETTGGGLERLPDPTTTTTTTTPTPLQPRGGGAVLPPSHRLSLRRLAVKMRRRLPFRRHFFDPICRSRALRAGVAAVRGDSPPIDKPKSQERQGQEPRGESKPGAKKRRPPTADRQALSRVSESQAQTVSPCQSIRFDCVVREFFFMMLSLFLGVSSSEFAYS